MAPFYFPKLIQINLRLNVKNKMTLMYAKFDADLINISEVTSRETKWRRFFRPTLYMVRQHVDARYFSVSVRLFVCPPVRPVALYCV